MKKGDAEEGVKLSEKSVALSKKIVVTIAACWLPAIRAAKVAPRQVLG